MSFEPISAMAFVPLPPVRAQVNAEPLPFLPKFVLEWIIRQFSSPSMRSALHTWRGKCKGGAWVGVMYDAPSKQHGQVGELRVAGSHHAISFSANPLDRCENASANGRSCSSALLLIHLSLPTNE